ncbi:MAG: trimeric intracellular cation channel family protein [Paludibacteraceae bacterium]|jgi:uncharacterized membrane protein YeiH|nr:trimeric intracellular cation channel family protein [Paludibacteraceae bacterium]MBO5863059.1 trimeric intracellular cation channel family protein [Paludibacteraceae bacterium]MBO5989257.1 trimeric intracellular cation channel family protein [Paludibacteraceae bacterium]MBQ1970526.1 trimeric intracellular cation channel family protein [Paludibacteraceae bacterium]MEE0997900.1 trimeric intracellular cation channel family protein [Paludibacteraceae bacterium]
MSNINISFILEALGTFAFAISGIRLAAQKDFDLFGAFVVGFVTAVGGGTIRDLLLDTRPFWMTDSIYLIWTLTALLFVILFRKYLIKMNNTFFIFDTIGLALFTVVGIEKSLIAEFPFWVAIIMGTITGVAGGIMRDICINEIPLIFRKEIYALACIFGGICYHVCHINGLDQMFTQIATCSTVLVIRILAVKLKISLPKIKGENA